MTGSPATHDFDYDNLTLGEAWPWFRAVVMILVGCTVAGILALAGVSLAEFRAAATPVDQPI